MNKLLVIGYPQFCTVQVSTVNFNYMNANIKPIKAI